MESLLTRIVAAIIFTFTTLPVFAAWNNPHQAAATENTLYSAFATSPKTLDPARSYSSDEIDIIGQIYEPPLQYHFLKRPYQLDPLTATSLPEVRYEQKNGQLYSVYDIHLKKGIRYQPHPCFVKNKEGSLLYGHLTLTQLKRIKNLDNFSKTGTRELSANDYAYEIKRLASPKIHSPIFGFISKYIVGMHEFSKAVAAYMKQHPNQHFIDLRQFNLVGVKVLGPYHYQITIKGKYPQFKYWLAMTFFAPVPWEADAFYSQPGLQEKNITLGWYPVGTGPYMMIENNPNKQMVLLKNPNFHGETYPGTNQALPIIEKVIFALDKETIPRWNKFLQGYYDKSGISADSFDQAIRLDKNGVPELTPSMKAKGIVLQTTTDPSVFYVGFNMLDPVVGGYSEKQKKLRRAIGIAFDYEEYISIFLNGRGKSAQGPIPEGIFGYESGERGVNPYIYMWFEGKPKRRSLKEARQLLKEAGYPNGINPKTKKPLILNYDVAGTGSPDDKAYYNWLRKQFAKLGVQLNIRSTLYNRFQDKVRTGKAQIFSWGWHADYPDPENFLFLLYGPNGKVKQGGENATNYANSKVDVLFEEIRQMPNGPKRQAKINELLKIVREDGPWLWGYHPIQFTLSHQWNTLRPPHAIGSNKLKYQEIDYEKRATLREAWNQPTAWPFIALAGFLFVIIVPLVYMYWRRERKPNVNRF